jgi:glycosyltransferase involved in cell wall biosynthesis
MTAHGAEFALARRKPWVRACLRRSLLQADALIANSSDTAAQIARLSGRTAEVIPFGSTVLPRSRPASAPPEQGPPRILFTGRLIQRKGVEYLLHAARHLLRTQPATFIITGDGDQRRRLMQLTQELELEAHVHFLGFISNEALNEEYARCTVWVNPSIVDDRGDTEGLGVGAIEAYAHGKPVVACNVGGIPDVVINDVTGLLVPQKDPVALAGALADLLNHPEKSQRLAAAGLHYIQQRFNWSTITRQLEEVYWRSLIDRGTCTGTSVRRTDDSLTPDRAAAPVPVAGDCGCVPDAGSSAQHYGQGHLSEASSC